MRISSLAALLALVTMSFPGCGESETAAPGKTSSDAGGSGGQTTTEPPLNVEIEGSWLYLGPWDGPHTLEITRQSVEYADIGGEWSSSWTLREYDSESHHFELVYKTGTGDYSPTGQGLSATYVLKDGILTLQLREGLGAFQPVESPGSCTAVDSELIPDCKIYMRQQ